ncbi:MAG: putative OB-fold protein [Natronomonas sp.]|jgi:uncharacterized OB-fold protein
MTDDPPATGEALPVDHAFVCPACDHRWYYTRARCPECAHDEPSTYELGTGDVVATTTVEVTPPDVRSPNRLGLVRFEAVQLIAQLEGEEVSVGDTVEFTGEYQLRDGQEFTGPRLSPVAEHS